MSILRRVLWGIGEMMWAALAGSVIAGVAYLLDGQVVARWPELAATCVWYASAALAGGVVLGLARPLTRSALGLGITGFLTAIPVVLIILFRSPVGEPLPVDMVDVAIAIAIAAVFGPLAAAYVVIRNRQRAARDHDDPRATHP